MKMPLFRSIFAAGGLFLSVGIEPYTVIDPDTILLFFPMTPVVECRGQGRGSPPTTLQRMAKQSFCHRLNA